MPFEKKSKKFITDSPKTNFFFGLIIGVAVVALVGFGVTAGKWNGDNNNSDDSAKIADEQKQEAPSVDFKITDTDHVLGDKDAPVKIFEFSDFQCPYCSRHHETMHKIVEDYDGKVAWVFKQFPIASHPLALPGAMASECAGEQDKFWEMSDTIFENQQSLTAESFDNFAKDIGLNVDSFSTCVSEEKYKDKIVNDYNSGVEAGVRGTPSNFINNQMVSGAVPYENLKEVIDELLK